MRGGGCRGRETYWRLGVYWSRAVGDVSFVPDVRNVRDFL